MKLILDFNNDNTLSITSDDDPDNFYFMKWDACRYQLWYNEQFVWERDFASTGHAVANVTGTLINAMRVS